MSNKNLVKYLVWLIEIVAYLSHILNDGLAKVRGHHFSLIGLCGYKRFSATH